MTIFSKQAKRGFEKYVSILLLGFPSDSFEQDSFCLQGKLLHVIPVFRQHQKGICWF